YCRYISGKLAALVSFSFGDYGAYADETEEFNKDRVRRMDEAFLVDTSRCLTLFDEIEAKILAEMKKP
ncbi:hypothetical protein, partial [Elstera litoralis]|uniref:hypothetical protein n=1 Tax=Elstera litoralis TaxID=552518 RepID=UPI0018DB3300